MHSDWAACGLTCDCNAVRITAKSSNISVNTVKLEDGLFYNCTSLRVIYFSAHYIHEVRVDFTYGEETQVSPENPEQPNSGEYVDSVRNIVLTLDDGIDHEELTGDDYYTSNGHYYAIGSDCIPMTEDDIEILVLGEKTIEEEVIVSDTRAYYEVLGNNIYRSITITTHTVISNAEETKSVEITRGDKLYIGQYDGCYHLGKSVWSEFDKYITFGKK